MRVTVFLLEFFVADKDLRDVVAVLGNGLGQVAVLDPLLDVLADQAGDHEAAAHADRLDIRASHRKRLEDAGLIGETAGECKIRNPHALLLKFAGKFVCQ